MNRKEKFQHLNKLNILKGYLLDENINSKEVLNVAKSLFKIENIKDIIQKLEEENFTDALNLVNNYILGICNEIFAYPCDKSWHDLILTNEYNTRFCSDCSKNVYLVSTEEEFIKRKNLQQCVALNTQDFKPDKKSERNFKSCRIKFFDEPLLGLPSIK